MKQKIVVQNDNDIIYIGISIITLNSACIYMLQLALLLLANLLSDNYYFAISY